MTAPDERTAGRTWLLVMPTVPGTASSLRVWVWRRLRSLGGLYLQQGTCLLPAIPDVSRSVRRVVDRVNRDGGSCRVLEIALSDPKEEDEIVAAFRAERTDEYGEIASKAPAFLEEIAMERTRGRTSYNEVEESEAELQKLKTWFERVRARDYFDAPGASDAEASIARCAAALVSFEEDALSAETQ
jgi:hypothetical protein